MLFPEWKQRLIVSAGSASPDIVRLGDNVLQLFWKDGGEPTMGAMLDYAQGGLCKHYDIRVSNWPGETPGDTARR
jgi:hypothetical protein